MQGKKPGGSSGGGRSGELQGDEAQRNKKKKKKVSCFSNIKIFLVSECALMLAQGTVGAYLPHSTPSSDLVLPVCVGALQELVPRRAQCHLELQLGMAWWLRLFRAQRVLGCRAACRVALNQLENITHFPAAASPLPRSRVAVSSERGVVLGLAS
ncbi:hypothetical protein MC885_015652 [Smutsia gigantea]|nr:hypothetical protein MC885_015652 [Smutsia gigantea]